MANRGQTIYNTVTKEKITFVRTTDDTNGGLLEFICSVTPDGIPLRPHIHANQEERFEIISGTLGVMIDGEIFNLESGDRAVLPAGMKHQWWNAGDDEVTFRVEAEPAGNLEAVLEANAGLAKAGKLNKNAMPRNPFHLVNIGKLSETYLPGIPIWFQKMGLATGSLVGRALGFDPTFRKYRAMAVDASADVPTAVAPAPIALERAA